MDFLLLIAMQQEEYGPALFQDVSFWNKYLELHRKTGETIVTEWNTTQNDHRFSINIPLLHKLCKSIPLQTSNSQSVSIPCIEDDQITEMHVMHYFKYLYWLLFMYTREGQCLDQRYIYPFAHPPSIQTIQSLYQHMVCGFIKKSNNV